MQEIPLKNLDQINSAVHDCVESCFGSTDVVSKIAAFLDSLRTQGWSRQELHSVELAALEILSSIIVPRTPATARIGPKTAKVHGV